MDLFSKSDPFIVLFRLVGHVWTRMGTTEVIHDTLDPNFVTKITVDFFFEQKERYKVEVYDVDDHGKLHDLHRHDFLGGTEFSMHELVTSKDQTIKKKLYNPNITQLRSAEVILTCEEIAADSNQQLIIFDPEATLKVQDLCFFILYK